MGEDSEVPTEETGLLKAKPSDVEQEEEDTTIQKDIHDTITLAMPIFLAMLSWVGVSSIIVVAKVQIELPKLLYNIHLTLLFLR